MSETRQVSTATNADSAAYGLTPDAEVTTITQRAASAHPDKPEGFSVVGKALPKVDGFAKVTGSVRFTDDLVLPRMAFAKLLRSTQPHARLKKVDCSKALAVPGVIAVATGSELPVRYGILPSSPDETVFAIDKVRYVGDPIAAIVADDELTAEEALECIDVEYEPLPAIMSIEAALREDLPKIHEESRKRNNVHKDVHLEFGDIDGGFAAADRIFEDEFFFEGNTHAPMEQHSALAEFGADGKLTLWASTQTPHYLHRIAAAVLDMPASHVRIIAPPVGGGFGGKTEPFAHELAAAHLARKTGRPVKITLTREEVFYAHRGRHPVKFHLKTGVRNDGSITACHLQSWLDGGAYGSYGVATTYYTGALSPVTYVLPAYKFDGCRVYTNKPPCGPKRGHGTTQPRFAFECHLDNIAAALGRDAAEYRKQIAVTPNSTTVNHLRITTCGIRECIDAVTAKTNYSARHGKQLRGQGVGIAASAYLCGAGLPVYWNPMPHSGAIVKVDRGGGVTVYCGTAECGQGSDHMLAVIVAETLGVDIMDVRVCAGDTDLAPVDLGSYSSRVTFMAGNAAHDAAERVRLQIAQAAAELLKIPANTCGFAQRRVFDIADPQRSVSFVEAAQEAEARFGTLSGVGSYTPPNLSGDYKGSGVGPSPAYSYSACVAEVSVDMESGEVHVDKLTVAHDCGRALNPDLVEGQIEGSAYMALGEALMEESAFRAGEHKIPNLLDYKTPTILDTPPIESIIIETDDREGPFGAKESGQGPLNPVIPAIANAIADAIGSRVHSTPITPEKILKAIDAASGGVLRLRAAKPVHAPV
ncbi:MAG: aldehyde oxidase [Candidatus Eremiobacter antarcticus]|nr:molybdopterin-dependent oxidoreductase [Candidatus Eremiobacteraeota bacterium]MBC5807335.1 molybdopterin-dependent oxidoreductase [Candidatus Eremiobacteraeota bacterium]PZR63090.1 MAG: aldehyde oxidase [Candidatus Eremiobacter sp. RRmetagenome_bin22]